MSGTWKARDGNSIIEVPLDCWRMRDGTIIKIQDMTSGHIKNALALIRRRGYVSASQRERLIEALVRYETALRTDTLGDMAEAQIQADFDELAISRIYVHPIIDAMEDELKRRKETL